MATEPRLRTTEELNKAGESFLSELTKRIEAEGHTIKVDLTNKAFMIDGMRMFFRIGVAPALSRKKGPPRPSDRIKFWHDGVHVLEGRVQKKRTVYKGCGWEEERTWTDPCTSSLPMDAIVQRIIKAHRLKVKVHDTIRRLKKARYELGPLRGCSIRIIKPSGVAVFFDNVQGAIQMYKLYRQRVKAKDFHWARTEDGMPPDERVPLPFMHPECE